VRPRQAADMRGQDPVRHGRTQYTSARPIR
jgi:hypothetical protein